MVKKDKGVVRRIRNEDSEEDQDNVDEEVGVNHERASVPPSLVCINLCFHVSSLWMSERDPGRLALTVMSRCRLWPDSRHSKGRG